MTEAEAIGAPNGIADVAISQISTWLSASVHLFVGGTGFFLLTELPISLSFYVQRSAFGEEVTTIFPQDDCGATHTS